MCKAEINYELKAIFKRTKNLKKNNYIIQSFMKTLDEFVELFAEQFDDTDASDITATTVFHDLDEWSSLIGLSVIAMVDEEFEVALNANEMSSAVTIKDLYNTVKTKANE